MLEGQFYPGQPTQFESAQPFRNPWHKNDFFEILTRLGLTTNLKLCLDAGDASSYTSGQSWLDLSGNGYDFFLGATGSATATDPTFNGAAGGLSSAEYWSFDGGDYFRYDTTNETWMQNLHKDNAVFTFAGWFYIAAIGTAMALAGTRSTSASNIGIRWLITAAGNLNLAVSNGSGTDALSQSSGSPVSPVGAGAWTFLATSLNEATGAGGVLWYRDGNTDTDSSTYSSPSASNATFTLEISAGGNGSNPFVNGSRAACFAAWEGTALTAAQLDRLYRASRGRFGV